MNCPECHQPGRISNVKAGYRRHTCPNGHKWTTRSRGQCPKCSSTWITHGRGGYVCKDCGERFDTPRQDKAKTHSGSGVIAGRITHGRGSYWHAG